MGEASLALSSPTVAVGDVVVVTASHFPPSIDVTLESCGDDALGGSADCEGAGSVARATSRTGSFVAPFVMSLPPVPCPCVIAATSPSLSGEVTVPVAIPGAPSAPLGAPPPPSSKLPLKVVSASIGGGSSWTSYFGFPETRSVQVEVSNPSRVAVAGPSIVVVVRDSAGRPVGSSSAVSLGTLAPMSVRTYELDVHLPALAIGSFEVTGSLASPSAPSVFQLQTSSYPWGLFALALLAFQVVVLRIHSSVKERLWLRRLRRAKRLVARPTSPEETVGTHGSPLDQ